MSGTSPAGLPTHEIPDGNVASAASQFRDAAKLLLQNLTELANASQIGQFNCTLPLSMLSGFALELYLKSMNSSLKYHNLIEDLGAPSLGYRVTSEPFNKIHSLCDLYDALDPSIKNELDQAYAESPIIASVATFRTALEPYSRVFENSRYIFENGRALPQRDPRDLMKLVLFVGRFVEAMPKRLMG